MHMFGRTGTAASLRGKPKLNSINENPGPGTYHLKFQNQEGRIQSLDIGKFSTRPGIVKRSGTPPVGSYNIDKGLGTQNNGWSMGLKN